MAMTKKKVAILFDNPMCDFLPYSKKVLLEARSLSSVYDVTVFCKNDLELNLARKEEKDGIKIVRCFDYFLGTTELVEKYIDSHIRLYNGIDSKFDVYHCHDPNTLPIGIELAKRDNAKVVYEAHEYFPDYLILEWYMGNSFKYELTKLLTKAREAYIKNVHGVITASEEMAQALVDYYKLERNPTTILNTRYKEDFLMAEQKKNEFNLREKYKIDEQRNILFFQGIVEPSRGIDYIVQALPFIDNVTLLIAGESKYSHQEELESIAHKLGCSEKLIFTGYLQSKELLAYTYQSDINLYFGKPTVLNMEFTIPNKMFDYLHSCKPMILSDLQSLKSFVTKYDIGEVINIHEVNVREIANQISGLIEDTERYNTIVNNMKATKERFVWEEEEIKLFALYESL